jgi:hypothetical protein
MAPPQWLAKVDRNAKEKQETKTRNKNKKQKQETKTGITDDS